MANGRYALGICDRSGQKYKLNELVYEISYGKKNGLRVGKDMVDIDHPQNHTGKIRPRDEQTINGARPEASEASSSISAFASRYPHTAGSSS